MSENTDASIKENNAGRKRFPLLKFAIIGTISAALGYAIVLVPSPLQFEPIILLGLFLGVIGLVMLVASTVFYLRRSKSYERAWHSSYATVRGGYQAIALGIVTLIVARVVQGILWPPPSVLSPQSVSFIQYLVSSILGGIIFGYGVGFYFVRYSAKIPLANPVYRALVVSYATILIFSALFTLLYLNNALAYFLWSVAYSFPSYSALGVVLGYSYRKFNSEQTIRALLSKPMTRKVKVYFIVAVLVISILFFALLHQQDELQPSSFSASDIHFVVSNVDGTIDVVANITNLSQPSLIQVDVSIDGLDDGLCGYGIQANQSMVCYFASNGYPLPTCTQLPRAANYTLAFSAYFSNTKSVIDTYTVESGELGCGQQSQQISENTIVVVTQIDLRISYPGNLTDGYLGFSNQTIGFQGGGYSTFNGGEQWNTWIYLPYEGSNWAGRELTSFTTRTPGFSVLSTSPKLPFVTQQGVGLNVSYVLQVPNTNYSGPVYIQISTT